MTRQDYDDLEGYAVAAMIGRLSNGGEGSPSQMAVSAFDAAEALLAEKKKRLGKKPKLDYREDD